MNRYTQVLPISAKRRNNNGATIRNELFQILKQRHICETSEKLNACQGPLTSSPSATMRGRSWFISINRSSTCMLSFSGFPFVSMTCVMLVHCRYPPIILTRYNTVIPARTIRFFEGLLVTVNLSINFFKNEIIPTIYVHCTEINSSVNPWRREMKSIWIQRGRVKYTQ